MVQGVKEKLCFSQFTATPPSPTHIAARDFQSSQRHTSVQALLLCIGRPIAAKFLRGRGGKIMKIHEKKNTIFLERPVV